MTLRFSQLQPWAIMPGKFQVDRVGARNRADLYRQSFRYVRAERRPEHCAPWVMGQELGWRVHSPVDVTLTPLEQIEVEADADPEGAATAVNLDSRHSV
jgi:hypothetical protein